MKINAWNIINNPRSTYLVICLYLGTAVIYSLCYYLMLPFFEGAPSLKYNTCEPALSHTTSYLDHFYFSITSQTTVGYGDIIPATMGGKIIAATQVFFGYFYLAFTISLFTCRAIVQSERFKSFLMKQKENPNLH